MGDALHKSQGNNGNHHARVDQIGVPLRCHRKG